MMTKEEAAQVITYCEENKISYKLRLTELGINPWSFYDAKRKHAPKQEGDNAGEFLQLMPGEAYFPILSNRPDLKAANRRQQKKAL